jgi:hypothetical protein
MRLSVPRSSVASKLSPGFAVPIMLTVEMTTSASSHA